MKSHIVFLAAWYPHEHDPMFGLFIHRHAALMTTNFKVSVLHVTYDREKKNGLFVSEHDNVFITNLNIRTKAKVLRWLYFFIGGLKAYRFICRRQGKPVLNHVHVLTRMGVLAAWIKCRRGIPFVVTEHWSRYFHFPGTYRNVVRKWVTRCVCRRASAMSAVSHHLQEAMQQHRLGRSKNWFIVNNVVDDEVFTPSGIDAKTERIRCINVSCFEDRSKNLSGLVESIEQLVGEGINIECVLAGVGEDFEKTGQLVKDKGLGNRIFFPGLLDKKEVAAQMQQSHFYVQPSHYENVPVVISEALMCGLPVVATKVGGLDEMIDEQNGYLIEPGNKAALTSALKIMADQYAQFDRDQISRNAVEKYSPEAVRRQFLQLYTGVIK